MGEDPKAIFDRVLRETGHAGRAQDEARRAQVPVGERCERCEGTGNELFFMYRRCAACGGTGVAET